MGACYRINASPTTDGCSRCLRSVSRMRSTPPYALRLCRPDCASLVVDHEVPVGLHNRAESPVRGVNLLALRQTGAAERGSGASTRGNRVLVHLRPHVDIG